MTTLTDTQVITASGGLVELGYSQITSAVNVTSTSTSSPTTVISAITVVCDGSPILVEFYSQNIYFNGPNAGDECNIGLWVDGAESQRYWARAVAPGTTDVQRSAHAAIRLTPSAGSHTFAVTAFSTNGTRYGIVNAGSGGTGASPAFLRVSKIVQATQWPAVTTGTIICTSSTRPASPFEGQTIYETDTDLSYRWSGSAWVSPDTAFKTPMASIQLTANIQLNDNTHTDIGFTTSNAAELFDTDGMVSLSASGSSITVQTAGVYRCSYDACWATNTTGIRYARIIRDRSGTRTSWAVNSIIPASTAPVHLTGSALIDCNVGDVIRLGMYQNRGGTLDAEDDDGGFGGTCLSAEFVSKKA